MSRGEEEAVICSGCGANVDNKGIVCPHCATPIGYKSESEATEEWALKPVMVTIPGSGKRVPVAQVIQSMPSDVQKQLEKYSPDIQGILLENLLQPVSSPERWLFRVLNWLAGSPWLQRALAAVFSGGVLLLYFCAQAALVMFVYLVLVSLLGAIAGWAAIAAAVTFSLLYARKRWHEGFIASIGPIFWLLLHIGPWLAATVQRMWRWFKS